MTERNQKKDQKDMFGKYDSDGEWDESLEKQLPDWTRQLSSTNDTISSVSTMSSPKSSPVSTSVVSSRPEELEEPVAEVKTKKHGRRNRLVAVGTAGGLVLCLGALLLGDEIGNIATNISDKLPRFNPKGTATESGQVIAAESTATSTVTALPSDTPSPTASLPPASETVAPSTMPDTPAPTATSSEIIDQREWKGENGYNENGTGYPAWLTIQQLLSDYPYKDQLTRKNSLLTSLTRPFEDSDADVGKTPDNEPGMGHDKGDIEAYKNLYEDVMKNVGSITVDQILRVNDEGLLTAGVYGYTHDRDPEFLYLVTGWAVHQNPELFKKPDGSFMTLAEAWTSNKTFSTLRNLQLNAVRETQKQFTGLSQEEKDRRDGNKIYQLDASREIPSRLRFDDGHISCVIWMQNGVQKSRPVLYQSGQNNTFETANSDTARSLVVMTINPETGVFDIDERDIRGYSGSAGVSGDENSITGDNKLPCGNGQGASEVPSPIPSATSSVITTAYPTYTPTAPAQGNTPEVVATSTTTSATRTPRPTNTPEIVNTPTPGSTQIATATATNLPPATETPRSTEDQPPTPGFTQVATQRPTEEPTSESTVESVGYPRASYIDRHNDKPETYYDNKKHNAQVGRRNQKRDTFGFRNKIDHKSQPYKHRKY